MLFSTYFISLGIVLLFTTVLFCIAQYKKDNSIIDTNYGIAFILASWLLTLMHLMQAPLSLYSAVLLILISVWGIRLSYRINKRNSHKGEDIRYAVWREEWNKKGTSYFVIRSYFQIFVLQGIIISIVLLPFTVSLTGYPVTLFWVILGTCIWSIGFLFEAIGDYQLDIFIKNKDPNRGTIMKSGLWKYSRHPNYFGESTMWWALGLIAYGTIYSALPFISPILITFLLVRVSGIPLLEKRWVGNSEWEEYKKNTSAFIPFFPKQ